ncbi:MAG: DUF374 domain-containing protein, partial [Candidatus Marinimicrobia bacterium]|nr:DUF374 domain-containing protein [Candidatus Neomarinimicrobiota bacterium]
GRLICVAWGIRSYKPTSLVSHSKDGEIIARIVQKWGIVTLRGSSRKGGKEALRHMMRAMQPAGSIMAVTMDGPVGPARVAKLGSLALAAKMNATIMPISASATRKWVFTGSWDDLQVPKPFGKVLVMIGEPLKYSADTTDVDLAKATGDAVTRIEKMVDEQVG